MAIMAGGCMLYICIRAKKSKGEQDLETGKPQDNDSDGDGDDTDDNKKKKPKKEKPKKEKPKKKKAIKKMKRPMDASYEGDFMFDEKPTKLPPPEEKPTKLPESLTWSQIEDSEQRNQFIHRELQREADERNATPIVL